MKIATFYSFKGGVGRSMGALNLAWSLTEKTRKVVLIDADLHAPGLTMSKHFEHGKSKRKDGIYGYLKDYLDGKKPRIVDHAKLVMKRDGESSLYFVPVADLDKGFDPAGLNFKKIDGDKKRQQFIEYFQKDLHDGFGDPDYVIVDARTGFTEIGGLFTVHLPDIVVLFSGLNEQNLCGTGWVLQHLKAGEGQVHLVVYSPVPEGEEELKKQRIEVANELLKKMMPPEKKLETANIPYHPRAALFEEIFVRDWKDSQIAKAYLELKAKFTALNDEDVDTIIKETQRLLRKNDFNQALETVKKGKPKFNAVRDFREAASAAALFSSLIPYRENRNEEALALVDLAIGYNERNASAHRARGTILDAMKKFDEALASYNNALKLKPDDAETHYDLGITLSALKRFDEAVASYDRALKQKPDFAEAYNNRGSVLFELNHFKEALESFDNALKMKPDLVEAHHNRGNALVKLNRLNEALASYEQALTLDPDYAEAYHYRGATLASLNRFDEALVSIDHSLKLDSDNADAHLSRGNILSGQDRFIEALVSFDKALTLKPDLAEAYDNRGITLTKLERFDEALRSFDSSLKLRPDDAGTIYNLACCLALMGRNDEALERLARAISFDPKYRLQAIEDEDFESLREDKRFIELIGTAGKKKAIARAGVSPKKKARKKPTTG